jgi:hypothetical protein
MSVESQLNRYQFRGGSLDGLSVEMPTPPNGTEFRLPNRSGQRFREVYEFRTDAFVFKKRALGTFGAVPEGTGPVLVIDEEHRKENDGATYMWGIIQYMTQHLVPVLKQLDELCRQNGCYLPPFRFQDWTLLHQASEE